MSALVFVIIPACVLIYLYISRMYTYWERRNVPTLPAKFPYGNMDFSLSFSTNVRKLYQQFIAEGNETHGGAYIFTNATYVPIDLDIIKNILATHHDHFMSRGMYTNPKQPLTEHLFSLSGEKWKFTRTKLSPTFTSGKMKMMYDILEKCSNPMVDRVNEYSEVNIKDVLMRYTIDVIGNCAFGLECNSFNNEDLPFMKMGIKAVRPGKLHDMINIFTFTFPKISRALNIKRFPTDVDQFYNTIVDDVCSYREKNNVVRNDFIQMLIDLKNSKSAKSGGEFTMDMIKAQAFLFFLAGFETSSSTMTFALFELARHQDVQDRVREEIRSVVKKHSGQFTYEGLLEMKYLTQVIEEALRYYPVVPILNRKCTKEYTEPKTGLVIEKNTDVLISVYGIHHNPEYYPDPEVFDPDRFSEDNKKNRLPYTWMPFGEGNMLCLGMRFGLMQTRLGLAKLINKYVFTPSDRTKFPLEFDTSILLMPKQDVYLTAKKIR